MLINRLIQSSLNEYRRYYSNRCAQKNVFLFLKHTFHILLLRVGIHKKPIG